MLGVPALVILTIFFYLLIQSRPGILGIGIFYLAPSVVALLAVLFLIWGLIRSASRRPFFSRLRIVGFAGLILLCFTDIIYTAYPSSYDNKPSKVAFRLPLDTMIAVCWGGAEAKNNYHVVAPDQRWAYDLMVMKEGSTFTGDSTQLHNYYCYGLPVLAPANGKVVSLLDTDPDMPVGMLGGGTDAAGNHIVLKVGPGEFLFICHLQPKSIKVKTGDSVVQGQPLALVGNSGNTSEPHIHLHLQSTEELGFGEGIPMEFTHYLSDGKIINRGIPLGGFDKAGKFIGQFVQHLKR